MEASLNSPNGRTALTANTLTIGRSPDNQLVIQDPQSSSHHAEIRPDAQGYVLTDLGSTNGTFVNEQQLPARSPRQLVSGDVIRIGSTRLTYEIAGSYDPTVRASAGEYANPGYSPTVAAPQPPYSSPNYNPISQPPGYTDYQQPPPSSSPNYQAQPAYPDYQQAPSSPNYQAQPAYPVYPQPQQPAYPGAQPGYPPQPQSWAAAAPVPGQYGAPGYPAPAAQAPRKNRTGLIIIGVIVLLLIIGGAIGGYIYLNRSTPEKTLTAFCTALRNNNANDAYNLLSASNTSQETESQFATQFGQLETEINSTQAGGLRDCTVSNVQQPSGSSASGTITISVNNSTSTLPLRFTLVTENGTWKLDKSQSLPTQ